MSDGMTDAYRGARSYGSTAERIVLDAIEAVEAMGADIRLTDAVVLLMAARRRLNDFSMRQDGQRLFPRIDDSESSEVQRLRDENIQFRRAAEAVEAGFHGWDFAPASPVGQLRAAISFARGHEWNPQP